MNPSKIHSVIRGQSYANIPGVGVPSLTQMPTASTRTLGFRTFRICRSSPR